MLVVDASILIPVLVDDTEHGGALRDRLRGESVAAPELIDLEVISVIRRHASAGHLDLVRAGLAVADLRVLPLRRISHVPLIDRIWELRFNLTPYDATYVALAELLGVVLVTADARLSGAPGLRCGIEVL